MDLRTYIKSLPDEPAREAFATRCETSIGHIRNVMYLLRPCGTELAVHIERESGRRVTRKELRPDWGKHWPELLNASRAKAKA